MATCSSLSIGALLAIFCSAASAESHVNASLAAVADDNDSQSYDADVAFTPLDTLQFGLGGGKTKSPSSIGGIDGKSLRGSVDLHSESFGVRGYYQQWNSRMFDTDTFGARAFIPAGAFTMSIAGERRGFDVDYMSTGTTPQRSTQHYSGTGWGGGLKYTRSGWSGFADAMFYHYGSLSRYVQTYTSGTSAVPVAGPGPVTTLVPAPSLLGAVAALPVGSGALAPVLPTLAQSLVAVAPVLSTSVVTLNQGALDRLFTVGIERGFTRVSLRLDWTGAKDAILSSTTNSYRAGVDYGWSDTVKFSVSAGLTDSYVGSAAFGGVSVAFLF